MPPEHVKRADDHAKQMGLRQIDVHGFSQAEISKIENRADIKLAALFVPFVTERKTALDYRLRLTATFSVTRRHVLRL